MKYLLSRSPALLLSRFIVAAAMVMFAFPAGAQGTEGIDAFVADIEVRADGHVIVQERIDYLFPEERHGIYRTIPETYVDEEGARYAVPFRLLSVTDGAGEPLQHRVESASGGRRIRIGDANVLVRGQMTYVLTYDVTGAVRYFEDHDELYWNVTGTDWEVPIRFASASVALPDSVEVTDIRTRCFTGDAGSTSEDCSAGVQGHFARFSANGNLTIVAGWPKGHVAVLKAARPRGAALSPLSLWPLLIPILAFAWLYRKWHSSGRDIGATGTLVVQYEPPKGARPADVGFLIDERVGVTEVTATIVDLAVRGYLRITEIEKKGIFSRGSDFEFTEMGGDRTADPALKPYEASVLNVLFGFAGKSVKMSTLAAQYAFNGQLGGIQGKIADEAVAMGFFVTTPAKAKMRYILMGLGVMVIGSFFAAVLTVFGNGGILFVASILTGLLCMGFAPLMAQKTAKGTAAVEHARGFKEYLEKAEKYRLKWQEQEKMFEAFLPYAMVFGVADKYAKAFAAIGLTPPASDWYRGAAVANGHFNAAAFAGAMSSLSNGLSRAVTSVPAQTSSGSGFSSGSSGGRSGGGFGGGGGGSW